MKQGRSLFLFVNLFAVDKVHVLYTFYHTQASCVRVRRLRVQRTTAITVLKDIFKLGKSCCVLFQNNGATTAFFK